MKEWEYKMEDDWESIEDIPLEKLVPFTKSDFTRRNMKNLTEAVRRLFLKWEGKHVELISYDGQIIEPHIATSTTPLQGHQKTWGSFLRRIQRLIFRYQHCQRSL